VIVTHDAELAGKTQRIIRLKGGHVVMDQLNGASLSVESFSNTGKSE
jgi:ABC-type lipoprotein export system ATPase subunit